MERGPLLPMSHLAGVLTNAGKQDWPCETSLRRELRRWPVPNADDPSQIADLG